MYPIRIKKVKLYENVWKPLSLSQINQQKLKVHLEFV